MEAVRFIAGDWLREAIVASPSLTNRFPDAEIPALPDGAWVCYVPRVTITAKVHNQRIELPADIQLPEGTEVQVHASDPAWMRLFGAFGQTEQARAETRRIQQVIDAEFGAC